MPAPHPPIPTIHSRENPSFRACLKLVHSRKARREAEATLLEGTHLLAAALDAQHLPRMLLLPDAAWALSPEHEVWQLVRRWQILCKEQSLCEPPGRAEESNHRVPYTFLRFSAARWRELSTLESPALLLAWWLLPPMPALQQRGMILALDGVQDPGNLGTILRSAAAVGVDQVWLGRGCTDPWSPKALRAGMGAQCVLSLVIPPDLPTAIAGFAGKRWALSPPMPEVRWQEKPRDEARSSGSAGHLLPEEERQFDSGSLPFSSGRRAGDEVRKVREASGGAYAPAFEPGAIRNRPSMSLFDVDLQGDLLLVMGAEGAGISDAVRAQVEATLYLPQKSAVESLNVASAATVCLYLRGYQAQMRSRRS